MSRVELDAIHGPGDIDCGGTKVTGAFDNDMKTIAKSQTSGNICEITFLRRECIARVILPWSYDRSQKTKMSNLKVDLLDGTSMDPCRCGVVDTLQNEFAYMTCSCCGNILRLTAQEIWWIPELFLYRTPAHSGKP